MPGIHQGSLERYAPAQSEKEDGRGNQESIAAPRHPHGTIKFNELLNFEFEMNHHSEPLTHLPPEQEVIRAMCFHPSGAFVEFPKEDVETSIPARFEKIVRIYPEQIAVKSNNDTVTYTELNATANRIAHTLLERLGPKTQLVTILLEKDVSQLAAMLGVFLQEAGFANCTTLRQFFCSGEALSYELQQRFFERTGAALHNLYGPTEASIDVTAWECRRDSDCTAVPIGRPIANTQIYILDQYLAPVPVGVVGEIYIGGDGLARSYLNQPELTAEKFIYHSFNGEPARRLYKTGDLARYLPDGNIEFLGRVDNQVKIRGFRIELGEIEATLAQHPDIQQAVLLAREDTPGDRRLVSYWVATDGSSPSAHDLRSFLHQKLPDYMVPSTFVFLDSLPLTPNGKLDRKALPAPDQSRTELNDAFAAPRNPVAKILADIWCTVLKLDKVGIHDNFFHLGGHSLLATRVVSRIRDAFKLDLPFRALFEAPTVQGLAQKLKDIGDKQEVTQTEQITPVAREQYRVQRSNYQA